VALRLNTESDALCCGVGKHKHIPLPVMPQALTNIIEQNPEVQKKSGAYNKLFSFTAVSASAKKGF